jgi:hypothetical protein
MPSIYQMLPRASDGGLVDKHTGKILDPLDFNLWVEKQWGLANPDQDPELARILPGAKSANERRHIALDHLRKCLASAKQFQAAMDRPASRPHHLQVMICAGKSKNTPAQYAASQKKVKINLRMPGDGMVPLYSVRRCSCPVKRGAGNIMSWDGYQCFGTNHNGLGTKPKVSGFLLQALSSR